MAENNQQYAEYVRVQREIGILSHMVTKVIGSHASEAKDPIVTLDEDMWPPRFMKGVRITISFCKSEEVDRGHFVVIRFKGRIRVVRYMGWRYYDGRVCLCFIPGPRDYVVVTTSEVELLGEIISVVDAKTGKNINPNKENLVARFWNSATNYGTNGFWSGLYKLVDAFVQAASTKPKKAEKNKEPSIWAYLKMIKEWTKHEEEEKRRKKLESKAKKIVDRRTGRVSGLEFTEDEEKIEEESYDDTKRKLASVTSAEMDSWWNSWEDLKLNSTIVIEDPNKIMYKKKKN